MTRRIAFFSILLGIFTATLSAKCAAAASEKALHNFASLRSGQYPENLAADGSGNLYGTTSNGGVYNFGVVYKFAPNGSGGWMQTVLHSFKGGADGSSPVALVLDVDGNLYGTTLYGGTGSCGGGCGLVFKLTPNSQGGWTESVIYNFQSSDGGNPVGGLAFDSAGKLYGATEGNSGTGIVFELTPSGSGAWTEAVVHTFSGGTDGAFVRGLVVDSAGNVYGTTENGGVTQHGTVFELIPSLGNVWTENVLYTFSGGRDGNEPSSTLILRDGNVYGTTLGGGIPGCSAISGGCGVVFELTPGSNGTWAENVLYAFQGSYLGVIYPSLAAFDTAGNLYGFASQGGTGSCNYCGQVFELTPQASGKWHKSNLWNFTGYADGLGPVGMVLGPPGEIFGVTSYSDSPGSNGVIYELSVNSGIWSLSTLYNFPFDDAQEPTSSLVADAAGNLYGTTAYGGTNNVGAVFRMSRTRNGGWKEDLIYSFGPASYVLYYTENPSGLVFDAAGNLYGTTGGGGAYAAGSLFELSPRAGGGGWDERNLVSFNPQSGPMQAVGGVVFDKAGHIYGVSTHGGTQGLGTVFQMTQSGGGRWTLNVIYNFSGYPSDGAYPGAGLTIDAAGDLYGTTQRGGTSAGCLDHNQNPQGCGTAFELSYAAGTGWTEKVLHSFQGTRGNDGATPQASLTWDGAGNLYGTTLQGGVRGPCEVLYSGSGCGTVFELTPSGSGEWIETVLYEFAGRPDGENPSAGLVWDQQGNLYATASGGGNYDYGMLFELSPLSGGGWSESVIYNFGKYNGDGRFPGSALIWDGGGDLYGTTLAGGIDGGVSNEGQGTVFEITP
jgi:uncharacterized repeat protein (TIGR03803 family)